MSDEFIDPLNDPRFPDRPQHSDFWRLSEQMLKLDADATERGLDAAIEGLVDFESAKYIAENMAVRASQILPIFDLPGVREVVMSIAINAMTAGIAFEKAGGHRPA